MQQKRWKFGDSCFIYDLGECGVRVMPASVSSVHSDGHTIAMAEAPECVDGVIHVFGKPYETEREARQCARQAFAEHTSWFASQMKRIPLEGHRPALKTPPESLEVGRVVYLLDPEYKAVLRVEVALCRFEDGCFEAGYDSSPGNPEANLVRIREWWATEASAHKAARERYGVEFGLMTQEELAAIVDAQTEKVFSDALARMQSEEWHERHNESVRSLLRQLNDRSPKAAG